jgi:hypothetical protein
VEAGLYDPLVYLLLRDYPDHRAVVEPPVALKSVWPLITKQGWGPDFATGVKGADVRPP